MSIWVFRVNRNHANIFLFISLFTAQQCTIVDVQVMIQNLERFCVDF